MRSVGAQGACYLQCCALALQSAFAANPSLLDDGIVAAVAFSLLETAVVTPQTRQCSAGQVK